MRTAATAMIILLVLVAVGVPHAQAHGTTIAFTVVGDGAGHIRAAGTWGDEPHPVEEPMRALMTATPDDPTQPRIGPVPMAAVAGQPGVVEIPRSLPAGQWTVVVESINPALGRGEARLGVGATTTGFPPDFPPRPPVPHDTWWGRLLWPIAFAVIVVITILLARRPKAR
ncbi:hypothetical protein [Actinokineospora spheciospongiae]|uniref:hypothetical protein n=1 Tax=Actinokineospora spheciospongiae TaxID=909613 RepID=UPI000D9534B6|nr:hypothetical protein [Actinokineospora spheciospongiae]PWW60212.1 hypothetical protein DFQ13_1077 [Actinokineospora spheciospongiae]